jgi:hypothetical protein
VALVREQTIPTERPPLVGEVSDNFADRGVSHGQCGGSPTAVISISRPVYNIIDGYRSMRMKWAGYVARM